MRNKIQFLLGALLASAALILGAGHAGAQEADDVYGGEEPAEVCESGVGSDSAVDPECNEAVDDVVVQASNSPAVLNSSTGGANLPRTGVETISIALVGASAILLGTGLVLYKRRHSA